MAEKTGGRKVGRGRGFGMAFVRLFRSQVAGIVEVSLDFRKHPVKITVHNFLVRDRLGGGSFSRQRHRAGMKQRDIRFGFGR